jgi:hypothetical protein
MEITDMKTRTPSLLALGSLLLVLVAVVGISSMVLASSTLAGAANATAAQESVNGVTITALPDATCTLVG